MVLSEELLVMETGVKVSSEPDPCTIPPSEDASNIGNGSATMRPFSGKFHNVGSTQLRFLEDFHEQHPTADNSLDMTAEDVQVGSLFSPLSLF